MQHSKAPFGVVAVLLQAYQPSPSEVTVLSAFQKHWLAGVSAEATVAILQNAKAQKPYEAIIEFEFLLRRCR